MMLMLRIYVLTLCTKTSTHYSARSSPFLSLSPPLPSPQPINQLPKRLLNPRALALQRLQLCVRIITHTTVHSMLRRRRCVFCTGTTKSDKFDAWRLTRLHSARGCMGVLACGTREMGDRIQASRMMVFWLRRIRLTLALSLVRVFC